MTRDTRLLVYAVPVRFISKERGERDIAAGASGRNPDGHRSTFSLCGRQTDRVGGGIKSDAKSAGGSEVTVFFECESEAAWSNCPSAAQDLRNKSVHRSHTATDYQTPPALIIVLLQCL